MTENFKKFLKNHDIRVLDTNKRGARFNVIKPNFFTDPTDYNRVCQDFVKYDTEPIYTVEILESELERLADFESEVFNNLHQKGHYNMFEYLMDQKQEEKYLRDKYPAVKKAYEQYSLMLKLAKSGEL